MIALIGVGRFALSAPSVYDLVFVKQCVEFDAGPQEWRELRDSGARLNASVSGCIPSPGEAVVDEAGTLSYFQEVNISSQSD